MQGAADRVGADAREATLRSAQSVPQRVQRPSRRAIQRALRHPGDLGEDALLLDLAVADPVTAAVVRHNRSQTRTVEARHPARNSVAGAASDKLGRQRVIPIRPEVDSLWGFPTR